MSSEYRPLLKYLSVTRQDNSDATLDMKCLQIIREKFNELYEDNDIDDDDLRRRTIEKVMEDLKITNDQISFEYFDLAVRQESDSDAEIEIIEKFRGNIQFLEPIILDQPKKLSTSQLIENKVVPLDEIICIIHQKSDRSEIKDFIQDFLFKKIPPIKYKSSIKRSRNFDFLLSIILVHHPPMIRILIIKFIHYHQIQ